MIKDHKTFVESFRACRLVDLCIKKIRPKGKVLNGILGNPKDCNHDSHPMTTAVALALEAVSVVPIVD